MEREAETGGRPVIASIEKRNCQMKRAMFSRREARQERHYAERRYGCKFLIYICPVCCLYHLTTKPFTGATRADGR